MVPFCRGPEKPQAGCYELAHITPSEARLLLLRGRAGARVYAIGVAMAMEAALAGSIAWRRASALFVPPDQPCGERSGRVGTSCAPTRMRLRVSPRSRCGLPARAPSAA